MNGITVTVIGAGNFGRHYAKILSGLNAQTHPDLPTISRLVITKTGVRAAREFCDGLSRKTKNRDLRIIPEKVATQRDLSGVLDRYQPQLTCITATDPERGDAIHADYAEIALEYGPVLCEKPFCDTTGDGASLKRLAALMRHKNAALFGLELPMAVVREKLVHHPALAARFLNARRLYFSWGTSRIRHTGILDDLALHPWSLIPRELKPVCFSAVQTFAGTRVTGTLHNPRTGRRLDVEIDLAAPSTFRGLQIDELPISFTIEGTALHVRTLDTPVGKAAAEARVSPAGNRLLTVENPLAQNIIAAIQKMPLVDCQQTYDAQLFLEMAHGYVSED